MRRFLFVPILLGAAGVAALLIALGPEPTAREVAFPLPEVSTETVRFGPRRVQARAHGVVRPARRTRIAAEVPGRLVEAAPGLRDGARVAAGAPLFRIEPLRYELRVAEAESRLAEAELRLATERAAGRLARAEWEEEGEEPDPLALRGPQARAAEAALRAAEAALAQARQDLERTGITAPHAGLVGSRAAEEGEWVATGQVLLELLSVEVLEIRVSLPDAAAELLALPFGGGGAGREAPRARVRAVVGPAGPRTAREGRLVRVAAEVDPATRFLAAVVEVPGGRLPGAGGQPPLLGGMAVEVEIEGKEFPAVAVLPESAFRRDGRVLVVDREDRIRVREVDAFWTEDPPAEAAASEGARVLVRSGLAEGERVVVTPLEIVSEGMRVRVAAPLSTAPGNGPPGPEGGAPPGER